MLIRHLAALRGAAWQARGAWPLAQVAAQQLAGGVAQQDGVAALGESLLHRPGAQLTTLRGFRGDVNNHDDKRQYNPALSQLREGGCATIAVLCPPTPTPPPACHPPPDTADATHHSVPPACLQTGGPRASGCPRARRTTR